MSAAEPKATDYFGIVAGVEGWLLDDEVELLYRLASGVTSGTIVEIGSYRG